MEIISKISKGTRMDQVYLPKNRHGFTVGSYVMIVPVRAVSEADIEKPYFYNIPSLEPLKVKAVEEIFLVIDKHSNTYENIIITGSFLEKGFDFNDIDILLISEQEEEEDKEAIKKAIETETGIKTQLIIITNKQLLKGLATDPLYKMMLSRCVTKKRFIYKTEKEIDYKLLDLHLLKSKVIIDNFDLLDGNEKWYLVRNLICISLFLQDKKINKENVEKEIQEQFEIEGKKIKENMIEKKEFLAKYKEIYQKTFMLIMNAIKHGTKQK